MERSGTQSSEWFDAISRQGSKLSRASFQTARTDLSINDELFDSIDPLESEFDKNERITRNSTTPRKSVTFQLPEKDGGKRKCYFNENYDGEKSRSKTSPLGNNTKEQATREEGKIVGSLIEEKMRRERRDTLKDRNSKMPSVQNVECCDSFEIVSCVIDDTTPLQKCQDSSSSGLKTCKKKAFTTSFFFVNTYIHKENIQSTESTETGYNYWVKKSKSKYLTSPLQEIRYKGPFQNKEHLIVEKANNLFEKETNKPETDLPKITIEGEIEPRAKKGFLNGTILLYLGCNKICCFG